MIRAWRRASAGDAGAEFVGDVELKVCGEFVVEVAIDLSAAEQIANPSPGRAQRPHAVRSDVPFSFITKGGHGIDFGGTAGRDVASEDSGGQQR